MTPYAAGTSRAGLSMGDFRSGWVRLLTLQGRVGLGAQQSTHSQSRAALGHD